MRHALHGLLERVAALEPHLVLCDCPGREVDVGVGEARKHAAAAEVDPLRSRQRRLVRTHGARNPVAGDRERGRDRERRLHRPDDPVLEDHLCETSAVIGPAVPSAEVEGRLRAFQEALASAGFAGAVIVQSTDLYYLTGTTQSAHLVVPAAGDPILHVRKTIERARLESPLARVESLRSLGELPAALARGGVAGGRVGFELDVLPAVRYLDYVDRLPGYELGDCSPLLRRLRAVKSPWSSTASARRARCSRGSPTSSPACSGKG